MYEDALSVGERFESIFRSMFICRCGLDYSREDFLYLLRGGVQVMKGVFQVSIPYNYLHVKFKISNDWHLTGMLASSTTTISSGATP